MFQELRTALLMLCLVFIFRNSDCWLCIQKLILPQCLHFSQQYSTNSQLFNLFYTTQESILNSLSPQTLSANLSDGKCFRSLHLAHQLHFSSFNVTSICLCMTYFHSILKIRSSTIQIYLSGINIFFKLVTGHNCPSIHLSYLIVMYSCFLKDA